MADKSMFQEMLENAGFDPYAYSGRAMYGEKCLAVDTDDPFKLIADLIDVCYNSVPDREDENLGELSCTLRDTKTDSMGRGQVLYWPQIQFVGEDDVGEDDVGDDSAGETEPGRTNE